LLARNAKPAYNPVFASGGLFLLFRQKKEERKLDLREGLFTKPPPLWKHPSVWGRIFHSTNILLLMSQGQLSDLTQAIPSARYALVQ